MRSDDDVSTYIFIVCDAVDDDVFVYDAVDDV